MSVNEEFDITKDYYKVLDLPLTATQEEIKASYFQLARRYHPDVSSKEIQEINSDKFKEILEAFSLLSKADKRSLYDTARRQVTPRPFSTSTTGIDYSSVSDSVYATQKANYAVIAKEAGTHWKTSVDKYKTEKWLNKPLTEKKNLRKLPMQNFGNIFASVGAFVVLSSMVGYYWVYSRNVAKRRS